MSRAQIIAEIAKFLPHEILHGQTVQTLAAAILYDRLDIQYSEDVSTAEANWAMAEARKGIEQANQEG